MDFVRRAVLILVTLTTLAGPLSAQQSWIGTISDSSCKTHHEPGGEADLPQKPNDCVLACVRGGSKFVFATDDKKIYLIAKQDDPLLQTHAAAKVTVTGTLANDVLTITKIESAK